MKKLLFILGTRPEAIKMAPIIKECLYSFKVKVCLTNQHSNLTAYFSDISNLDIVELALVRDDLGLSGLMGSILRLLDTEASIRSWEPDLVLVHGDTTSSLCGSFYAFYEGLKLCHVEAGLRTHNKAAPFPEECNRKIVDYLSDFHFSPTELNKSNLELEGIVGNVHVVGNSVIDILKSNVSTCQSSQDVYGLVTLHRRENWGENITKSVSELARFSKEYKYKLIFVTNRNKKLEEEVRASAADSSFLHIVSALDVKDFHCLMYGCSLVVTDSGGIQEEAAYLGKPLFILRDVTERQEIIEFGCGTLSNSSNIYGCLAEFVRGAFRLNECKGAYGDGVTSAKIRDIINENILR